jgi:hypothetical protein
MERIKEILSHYLFPLLLILFGGGMVLYKYGNEQSQLFLVAGLAILIVGLITLLYSSGLIGRTVQNVLLVLLVPGAILMGYLNFKSVEGEIVKRRKADRVRSMTIQGLKDIRKVQVAFEERFGEYAASHDTLLRFLKEDSIRYIRMEGTRPDSLTESEALEKGVLQRDTLYTPVRDSLFGGDQKKAVRKGDRVYPFIVDSLPYKRKSGKKFIMDAGSIQEGGVSRPVFVVKDPNPFRKEGDTLQVGSMDEPSKSGNWSGR